jgi:hypothetical protein
MGRESGSRETYSRNRKYQISDCISLTLIPDL